MFTKQLLYKENNDMSTKKLSQFEFIERCKEKHGNLFDYSNTIYKNMSTKITVNYLWTKDPQASYFSDIAHQ